MPWLARICAIASLLSCPLLAAAQPEPSEDDVPPVQYPELARTGATPQSFVPEAWKIERRLDRDFDRDGRADVLLLLRMDVARNVISHEALPQPLDSNPRLLAALLATESGYRLAFSNHALIPRLENPYQDDPLRDLKLTSNGFAVELQMFLSAGSWWISDISYRFRFESGCFRLIGYDQREFHRGSGETTITSVNYLTGKVQESRTRAEGEKARVTRRALARLRPICAEVLPDGFGFDARTGRIHPDFAH